MASQQYKRIRDSLVSSLKWAIRDFKREEECVRAEYDLTIRVAARLLQDFRGKLVLANRTFPDPLEPGVREVQSDLTLRNKKNRKDSHIIEIKRGPLSSLIPDLKKEYYPENKYYPGDLPPSITAWAICFERCSMRDKKPPTLPSSKTFEKIKVLLECPGQRVCIHATWHPKREFFERYCQNLKQAGFKLTGLPPWKQDLWTIAVFRKNQTRLYPVILGGNPSDCARVPTVNLAR